MNILHSLLVVAVTALSTLATRATPFLLFGGKRGKVPAAVLFLGRVLPPAVMAILVVYSLKHISFANLGSWVNEMVAVAVTAAVHFWKRNTLLSIGIGTFLYMVLAQGSFL